MPTECNLLICGFCFRLHIVTWNVACKPPDAEILLNDLLVLNEKVLPDVYVIGLQEVKAQVQNLVLDLLYNDPWTQKFM